jgi:hypothetical protein
MNDHERRRLLEEHWERHANAGEFDSAHEIYHDDAVLEWPQSGERFVGRDTLRAMRQGAPPLKFTTWRIVGAGDLWVAENLMSVDGSEPRMCINVVEFRGDKVAREVVYITERVAAAEDRSHLAERFEVP